MRNHRFTGGGLHFFNYVFLNLPANRRPEPDTCQAHNTLCNKGVIFTKEHALIGAPLKNLTNKQKGGSPEGTTFLGFNLASKCYLAVLTAVK
jgi:hypothetical protein